MKPKHQKASSSQSQSEKDRPAEKFPGVAIPNDPKFWSCYTEKKKSADDDIVNNAMAELEALAPSQNSTSEVKSEPSSSSGIEHKTSLPAGTADSSSKKKQKPKSGKR
jgi:hypothetical protein